MAKKTALDEQTNMLENASASDMTDTPDTTAALASLFTSTATNAVSGSSVIGNYKKYKGRDIAAAYPDGVYIADFDFISVRDRVTKDMKSIGVYNFSDAPSGDIIGFTMGGAVINRLLSDWVSKIGGGDIETARNLYAKSGARVRVKLSYELNESTGNTIQRVVIR